MRRRDVLLLGAATAVAAHAAAQSQPRPKLYHIAIVLSTTPVSQINERDHPHLGAFLQELRRLGYTEGGNLIIERHSGEGRFERFSDLARSVVETKPDLIVAITDAIARPFKAATSTIPLVIISSDPVAQGLVGSLARPGGNITGVSAYAGLETIGKYLEILREIDSRIQRIGLLAPRTTWERTYGAALGEAADRLGIKVVGPPLESPVTEQEYHRVIRAMRSDGVQALLAEATGVNFAHVKPIAELAQAHHLPSLSAFAEHARLGGLVAYATDFEDQYRRMADQVHRILQGENPGELPFHRPTTFKLLLNLKAASTLNLTIPPTLLARADEVIE